jgi:nitroimidazol reductase NimA-like FMN-containing flavoprotein (pyridoxamine 5'-phosphate oxidase superfamily)
MSLAMTPAEREAFLAEVHVAVVTVSDDDGRGPLAIPLWYDYRPGGEIILVTDRMCAVHIRPEHWLTRDYTKAGG